MVATKRCRCQSSHTTSSLSWLWVAARRGVGERGNDEPLARLIGSRATVADWDK